MMKKASKKAMNDLTEMLIKLNPLHEKEIERMKTVTEKVKKNLKAELTDLFPYADETPLTPEILMDKFDFKRITVSPEESGEDKETYYYIYKYGDTYDLILMSSDGTDVIIFDFDKPRWTTIGELEMVRILFNTPD